MPSPAPGAVREPTARLPEPAPRRGGRPAWRLFAALLLLTVALRLPAFFVDVFNSDETFLATQAHVIRDGGNLYREAADRKPPLVPYVYAASFEFFGSTALWTVRVMAMLAIALTAWMVAVEARRRWGERAGWTAGLLLVLAMVAFAPQDGQAANFEVFMLPAMTAAVLLARRGRATSSGAAVAIATLAKQTGAATLLPVFYLVWKARGRQGAARAAVGFAAPLGLVAFALGPGQLVYWTVVGNGSYVSVRAASLVVVSTLILMTLAFAACNLPIVWRLPYAWRARHRRAADGGTDTDLWLWLISAAVSVALGLRFFGHYYIQLVPPLCLLTAGSLARTWRRLGTATIAFAAAAAIAFSAAGYFMTPYGREPRYQTVSRFLATHAGKKGRVLVWGNVPEIYWASNLRPATRLLTISTLTNSFPGRPARDAAPESSSNLVWDWFYEDLASHPPQFIVDTAPAAIRGAQYTPIGRFPRLEAIVDSQYRFDGSIDGLAVYQKRPD
ncbi:MAG TPA: glycosyltransferase family 39 protein [Acidimicrobiia bacterium]|jgi:4-amino-4-deoxy-L-arabinose transferase-like glycosyltransferase|nr:glycosyltransferase family 39 protein [Acidimicrobiia bacterium]